MRALALVGPALRARRRRILALLAFAGLFLASGTAARLLTGGEHGHVEFDRLFLVGGYPLVSALLLLGWLLGRFPLIAALVLVGGLVSEDRAEGFARVYLSRPVSPVALYGIRFLALAGVAFLLSAALFPLFDVIMLGTWPDPSVYVLILAHVLVYGSLVAAVSTLTRGDVWIALLLAVAALVWHALGQAGALPVPVGIRDFVGLVLPPQAALLRLEGAFAERQPVPWDAFVYAVGYAAALLLVGAAALRRREV